MNASLEKNATVAKLVGTTLFSATNFMALGWTARNPSMGQGCGLVGSVATTTFCNARNSSPVLTAKPLWDCTTRSVSSPPDSLNRIAMPLGPALGELSGTTGSGAPSEKRTVTGREPPCKWAALESVGASFDGVN